MPKLDRVILINAAGFDYLEFPVGGHGQVIGVNGHGKLTLLRTVLFFYLGTNEKAPYGLHETKSDFVSHYLGDPPSYLIYEVARGDGQPAFHIAVTRPAGRIQFHFIDAPFLKSYYLEGSLLQPIERVQQRLREGRCAHDSVSSYEEFTRRLYGIAPSPYAVFRPAPRSSGQVSILPRIISGIFTVSQLDADKLKAALTCGVREDALETELDLLQLKGHLENFRRVNRAVKTYLRYQDEAEALVGTSEEFEEAKRERYRAIEDLVRMAKRLPESAREIEAAKVTLESDQSAALKDYLDQKVMLDATIKRLGESIAVLEDKIRQGEAALKEYSTRQIERKAAELATLPKLQEELRLAQAEYETLTAKYDDENVRKTQMLFHVDQSRSEFGRQFAQRRADAERALNQVLQQLTEERAKAVSGLEEEHLRITTSFGPRRAGIEYSRNELNGQFKALADSKEPDELRRAKKELDEKQRKHRDETLRLQSSRAEVALAQQKREHARQEIERNAETERSALQLKIEGLKGQHDRAVGELDKFDGSLARFFQTKSPENWPHAAKALARETLFHNAQELDAKATSAGKSAAWGVEFATEKLAQQGGNYDREALEATVQELQKLTAEEKDRLTAAHQRYMAAVDAFEKQAMQTQSGLQAKIENSLELSRNLSTEIDHLENRIFTLTSQFQAHLTEWRNKLDSGDIELKKEELEFRKDEREAADRFLSRKRQSEADFDARKERTLQEHQGRLASIGTEESDAKLKNDDDRDRIEKSFQQSLVKQGVNKDLIEAASKRVSTAKTDTQRIGNYVREVAECEQKKREFIDPLDSLRSQERSCKQSLKLDEDQLAKLGARHQQATAAFKRREQELSVQSEQLKSDQTAVTRFRDDKRFLMEWGYFEREDLAAAPFYRPGATREYGKAAEAGHEKQNDVEKRGDKSARSFLNHFDAETLDRKVLGFAPIHEHFNWYIFVGAELRPFVNGRGIQGMKQIQTQEFEQLIRNICAKNADFKDGIRQVRQTAALVQENLEKNNFVDVLDSIELKVERVDNKLTQILGELEAFAGLTFSVNRDLFGKRADREQIEKAIDTFMRLVREIDTYGAKQLRLTDYFDFQIRVHENGHDMGWRKSLDHIGSTGTDYLVKMLIYLSLIEVYRERAIDPKAGSTVHCVLDETGVLAPKYVRSVLEYAKSRGIILITAGHSQQTVGFDNWVRVRKRGQRFGGQTVLRKVLQCD